MDFIAIIAGQNTIPDCLAVRVINAQGKTANEVKDRMHHLPQEALRAMHIETVNFVTIATPAEYYSYILPKLTYTVTSEAEFVTMTEIPEKQYHEHERVLA